MALSYHALMVDSNRVVVCGTVMLKPARQYLQDTAKHTLVNISRPKTSQIVKPSVAGMPGKKPQRAKLSDTLPHDNSRVLSQAATLPQADQGAFDPLTHQNCLVVQRGAKRPFVSPYLPPRGAFSTLHVSTAPTPSNSHFVGKVKLGLAYRLAFVT